MSSRISRNSKLFAGTSNCQWVMNKCQYGHYCNGYQSEKS